MKRATDLDPNNVFKSAAHWRMRAEEMRTIVQETHDPKVKAMMLRIAADYDRLARYADDETAQDSMTLRVAADYDRLIGKLEDETTPHSNLAGEGTS
jgi:hypothetical protein